MDINIPYHKSAYTDCKVILNFMKLGLTVVMSSTNGKIPAGSIDLKITANGKLITESP